MSNRRSQRESRWHQRGEYSKKSDPLASERDLTKEKRVTDEFLERLHRHHHYGRGELRIPGKYDR